MNRLKWLRGVTVAVVVLLLVGAVGFALTRSRPGDSEAGAHSRGHGAGPEGHSAAAEQADDAAADDDAGQGHEGEGHEGEGTGH